MKATINEALKKGVVKFQYRKNDGSLRTAMGTTNSEIIGKNYTPRGGVGPEAHGYMPYWDVDADGWRCFNENALVAIL